MSFRKLEIIDHSSPFIFFPPKPISLAPFYVDEVTFSLLDFPIPFNSVYDSVNDSVTDLIQIKSTHPPIFPSSSYKRVMRRVDSPGLYRNSLSDRVSSLEIKFAQLLQLKEKERRFMKLSEVDRKYSWTAEIKGGDDDVEKKYKWTAEIVMDDYEKEKIGERKYQWITESKGMKNGDEKRTYTWKATIGGGDSNKGNEEKEKKCTKKFAGTRIVEIEEPSFDHRALVLRQAFAKRTGNDKGKKKEISVLDAAVLIQLSFRAYLTRRSQALGALRDLAVAKSKLKELRSLFHNFSYRSRVSGDAEERQKFSEKIIVLLLTVDAIQGVDLMVRAAKRSMVDELEAMLDVVDPQPGGRSLSMRRRTFDMPSGTIQKENAEGVAQVVQMLNEENGTFEACI